MTCVLSHTSRLKALDAAVTPPLFYHGDHQHLAHMAELCGDTSYFEHILASPTLRIQHAFLIPPLTHRLYLQRRVDMTPTHIYLAWISPILTQWQSIVFAPSGRQSLALHCTLPSSINFEEGAGPFSSWLIVQEYISSNTSTHLYPPIPLNLFVPHHPCELTYPCTMSRFGADQTPPQVKLYSLNIRGLNIPEKRSQLLLLIWKSRADVVFLQETHFKSNNIPNLHDKFYPIAYHATTTESKSKGVPILI